MEHYEQVKLISPTFLEINRVHNAVSLLQQVQCMLILFSLYELISTVVQFSHNNGDFVLRYAQLLVIVAVETLILSGGVAS